MIDKNFIIKKIIEKDQDINYLKYCKERNGKDRYDFYCKLKPLICTMAAYIQQWIIELRVYILNLKRYHMLVLEMI